MTAEPPRLDRLIPEQGFADADEALEAFLEWTTESGLALYDHQEEAVLEVFSGHHLVLNTPTGSGKSLVATALHFKTFAERGRTVYTAPIKALVSEKFFALCHVFGAEHVGLMTGDGAVNRDAPILCCTAEILANIALREGTRARVDSVVMDEFHYYADRDRGMAWQIPLLLLTDSTFLLMSATLGDTSSIRDELEARTERTAVEVSSAQRPVPLEHDYRLTPIHETLDRLLEQDKAPVYVVHFTQRAATEQAQALMSIDPCTKEEKRALAAAVAHFRFDSPFGPAIRRYVRHGVGLHHAGLLPRYRLLMEKLAQQGLLKLICGTDTLGVGINVPIRTVLFTRLCKFDGQRVDLLRVRDFKQISGRAGRAGHDTVGYVVAQAPEHIIENKRIANRAALRGRKKPSLKKAPTRGYKHWDREIFERMVSRPPERLEPRFQIDHGRLLTLMQHVEDQGRDAREGLEALLDLIGRSHVPNRQRVDLGEQAVQLLADLVAAGVVHGEADQGPLGLDPGLQRDFSLYHSLSLFLLEALDALEPESEAYALDVVSLTESILEDPRAVLFRQADKARDALHWELKAAGVPYEERIEALKEVSWPQPGADWIEALFATYAERHPWVAGEAIRPKAVLRDMVEQYASFSDYVKDFGLQRSEGVLLRYLTEVYKALMQNVPAERRTEELLEVLAYLRAMLARVDASLVTEWERLVAGRDVPGSEPERPVDISEDKRAFQARIRAELHALVRALSRGDYEEAAACVRPDPEGATWSAGDFEDALADYLEEYGQVTFDHRARLAHHTTVRRTAPHRWEVTQVLIDDRDHDEWSIDGTIDLRRDTNPDGPLVVVRGVGL